MSTLFPAFNKIQKINDGPVRTLMSFEESGNIVLWILPNQPGDNDIEARFNQIQEVLGKRGEWVFFPAEYYSEDELTRMRNAPLRSEWSGRYGWIDVPDDRHTVRIAVVPEGHPCDMKAAFDWYSDDDR